MGTLKDLAANTVADLTNTPVEKVKGRKTHKSKSQREAEADSAGLKGTFRDEYVNTSRVNTYNDTFWDGVRKFFGGKLGSEEFQESLDLKDQDLINTLLDSQRQQEYNSEEAQAARLRDAGINPDLDGGASLTPSEAAQIDDETFGAGLTESLGSIQNKASSIYSDAAQVFMNGATSILGLVKGGFEISNLLAEQDLASLRAIYDFGGRSIDNDYDPLDFGLDSKAFDRYKDKDGNIQFDKIDWDRLYRERYGLRSPRIRKMIRNAAGTHSNPYRLAGVVGTQADVSNSEKTIVENEEYIQSHYGGPRDLGNYNQTGANWIGWLYDDPTYQKFVKNAAQFKLQSMRATIGEQRMLAEYYEELNRTSYGKRKAVKDRFMLKLEKAEAENRLSAAQSVSKTIQELISLSNKGDWMATIELQSILSGSFQSFGLGNPMDLPMYFGDKLSGFASDLMNLATKGLFKPAGFAGKTAKAAKAGAALAK